MLNSENNPTGYAAPQKHNYLHAFAGRLPQNLIYADYHRWILWLPVFLGVGIGLYFSLKSEPLWYIGVAGLVITGFCAWLFRKQPFLFLLSLVIGTIILGYCAAQLRTLGMETTTLQREIGPINISGHIVQMETMPRGNRVVLDNLHIDGAIEAYEIPQKARIRINTSKGEALHPGDWIKVYAVLRAPPPPSSPNAFDFQRYAYFKGIGAVGFSMGIPKIIRYAGEANTSPSFDLLQSQFRQSVGERIRSALPGEAGLLAMALITGEKKAIAKPTVEAMRDAGLAHLLAISGLHIGLVAGLVFFVVRAALASIPRLAVRYPIKTWAALAALSAALGYTILAGSTIPTLRAFTMMSLVLGAIMMGRRGITLRLVAVAATVILLTQPESLLGASFQLSFAAVTGLVASYETIAGRLNTRARRKHGLPARVVLYVGGVGLSTLIAGLSTTPFAAYHFHQLASYGLVANLVAVPVTALWIMPSAVMALIAMPFGMEIIGLMPMGWGIEVVLAVAKSVAALPGNVRAIPAFAISSLVIIALGGLWLGIWQHKIRLLGVPAIATGIFLALSAPQPALLAHTNAKLFAVQTTSGITVLGPGARANRFTREIWTERAGFNTHKQLSEYRDGNILCDQSGCMVHKNGLRIALVWEEAALIEDCWIADILISRVPVRRACPKPKTIIDRFDLWRDGTHAIYLDNQSIRIENTQSIRGTRPWTISPRPRRKKLPKIL